MTTNEIDDQVRAEFEAGLAAGKTPLEMYREAVERTQFGEARHALIRELAVKAAERGEWDDRGPLPAELGDRLEAEADRILAAETESRGTDVP
ncbi:hypothetical protein ACWCYY_18465 [Kitasatospora sp. NPDC001664]